MTTKQEALTALLMLANAIVETVKEAGEQGAPGGSIYAALMDKVSLETYSEIMAGLVEVGKLRKVGHVYFDVAAATPTWAKPMSTVETEA
jgi:hypothetical protein